MSKQILKKDVFVNGRGLEKGQILSELKLTKDEKSFLVVNGFVSSNEDVKPKATEVAKPKATEVAKPKATEAKK